MKKLGKYLLLSSLAFLLCGCTSEQAEELGNTIKGNLIPSWLNFALQVGALLILVIIVIFVAYKPVKKMLKKRADYIEKNITDAENSKAIAAQLESQSKESIIASKKEAAEIIESAQIMAKKQQEEMIAEAQQEVVRMKANAEMDIEKSKQEALEEIHDEMVNVALSASSEILKREVSEEDNKRIAEDFIEKL